MTKILIVTLWTWLIASNVTECFSGGKIYTMEGMRVINVVDVRTKFAQIDSAYTDMEARAAEKKRIIDIIKTQPCR